MLSRLSKCLIVMPVLLAGWLTFRAEPVTGLPLNQVVMVEAPQETSDVADGRTSEVIELN